MGTRSSRKLYLCLLSCAGAGALLLAACGSSSKSAGTSSSTTTGATSGSVTGATVTPTKSPAVIGALVDISGPSAGARDKLAKVIPAWQQYINSKGGLNGHPVKVDIRDVQSNPATAQTEEESLLQEHPIAWFVDSSATEGAQASFLRQSHIPIIGAGYAPQLWGGQMASLGLNCSSATNSPLPCALPNAFTVTTTFGAVLDQAAVVAKAEGATKMIDVVCAEIDACSSADPELKATAKKIGIADAGLVKVSSSAPSYTSQCVQFIQEKIDWIELSVQDAAAAQMIKDCQDQGYTGSFGVLTGSVCCSLLAMQNVKLGGGIEAFPWWVDNPPVQQYRAAMAAANVPAVDWETSQSTGAWTALQMFAAAQAHLSANPTAAEALANMYTLKNQTLGGLIPPITFTQGQTASPRNCFWPYLYQNGKISNPLGGVTYECYPAQS
jgi:branched-chain amino acid transport system substrate-binding protein